jgi:hypothetical protein
MGHYDYMDEPFTVAEAHSNMKRMETLVIVSEERLSELRSDLSFNLSSYTKATVLDEINRISTLSRQYETERKAWLEIKDLIYSGETLSWSYVHRKVRG